MQLFRGCETAGYPHSGKHFLMVVPAYEVFTCKGVWGYTPLEFRFSESACICWLSTSQLVKLSLLSDKYYSWQVWE